MPVEYDPVNNEYVEVGDDASQFEAFRAGLKRPGVMLGAGIESLMGNEDTAQRLLGTQNYIEQASGGANRATAQGLGSGVGEALVAAPALAAAPMGLPAVIGAEMATQALMYGPLEEKALRMGMAAIGGAAIPAASAVAQGVMKTGTRAGSMAAGTRGILKEAGDTVESYRIQLQGPRSAGAAQQTPGRSGELFLDEAEEIFPSMTNAQRNMVAGDDSAGSRMALRRDENKWQGSEARRAQEGEFGQFFMREIAPDNAMVRDFSKQGIRDSLDDVGEQMNQLEAAMPDAAVPPQVQQMAAEMAQDRQEDQFKTIAGQMGGSFKNAQQQIRRQIDRFDRAQMYDARDALMTLKSELDEALDLPPAYKELQRKYAIGMAALDNEVVLGGGGAFNVKSLVNRISKNYKPFRHGADDSTFGRALRTMQTLQQKQTPGSPTADRLTQGLIGGGALGTVGAGLLGM